MSSADNFRDRLTQIEDDMRGLAIDAFCARGSRRLARRVTCAIAACAAMTALAAEPPATHGRLWRIAKPGIADSYVLGTIHLGEPDIGTLPAPVRRALLRSRVLATELPFEALSLGPTMGLAAALATGDIASASDVAGEAPAMGVDLEPMIGGPAFVRLSHRLATGGFTPERARRMKAWVALLRVTREEGLRRGAMLDEVLVAAGRGAGLRIMPLEGVDDQAAAFDMVPLWAQGALLSHALMHPGAEDAGRRHALDAWRRGDLCALLAAGDPALAANPVLREAREALERHLIVNRTAVMHHRLFLPLRRGRVFVAVGASHLPGENGLLALLREDGYRVTRVW